MVVIPTEKRFDWKRPPYVLLLLVLSNIFIFFFVQGDDQKDIHSALSRYEKLEYFETEWPLYLNYLQETGVSERTILKNEQLKNHGNDELLSLYLITDKPFFNFLKYNQVRFQEPPKGNYWQDREEIFNLVNNTAIYGYGLKPKSLNPFDLFTHQFLHADLFHLIGNMFFLVVFGFAVEAAIGQLRFLLFYLLSGLAGGVLFMTVNSDSPSALIGASGAISGVMAMYLGVFRLKKIEFFYWFFIFVGFIRAPAMWVLALYIANELFNFLTHTDSNIAFMAHIGGFVTGAVLVLTTYLVDRDAFDHQYVEEGDKQHPPEQSAKAKIYQLVGNYAFDSALKQINAYLENYGSDFDLELLKYHILQVRDDEQHESAALRMLTMEKLDNNQMLEIEKVWRDSAAAKEKLTNEQLLQLGWRACCIDNLRLAEAIFLMLYKRGVKTEELSHLSRKLSILFGEMEFNAKCKKYAKAADELLERSRRFSSF